MNEPGIIKLTPLIIVCVLYQIVWVAFITYLAWFWLIRKYPASRIASFTFLTALRCARRWCAAERADHEYAIAIARFGGYRNISSESPSRRLRNATKRGENLNIWFDLIEGNSRYEYRC